MKPAIWILCALFMTAIPGCASDSSKEASETNATGPETTYSVHLAVESRPASLEPEVFFASDTIATPLRLAVVGDYVAVQDAYADTPLHVLDAKDGRYIATVGAEGEGPGEFAGVWSLDVASHEDETFWAYDMRQKRLTYVDLPGLLKGTASLGDSMVTMDVGFGVLAPTWISDTTFLSPAFLNEPGRLAVFDADGDLRSIVGEALPNPDDVPQWIVQHAYQARMAPHPDRSMLALATFYADRLEIYAADGSLRTVARGPDGFDPIYTVGTMQGQPVRQSTPETRNGYIDVAATDRHIYALYSGKRTDDWGQYGVRLHVFTWAGALVRDVALDTYAIGIAVTPDGSTLYASQHYPDLAVVRFDLSDLAL